MTQRDRTTERHCRRAGHLLAQTFDTVTRVSSTSQVTRAIRPSFVVPGPSGVAVRDRLKGLTTADETLLRLVGAHLGTLASSDLKARCADGLDHSAEMWATRKRVDR
jgi:hypothetical protein